MLGDAMVVVAIGLYVTRLTGDPGDVGLVLASYSVPLVVFVLVGGVIADRLPRQRVMIASDVVRAVLHGTLAVLIVTGAVRIWQMMVIGALFGTAEAFFRPAYTGLVPQTVPERDIQQAQALGGISNQLAQSASPALATALVLGVGGAAAFALDAATFVVSALLLWQVRPRRRGEPVEQSTMLTELRHGWAAVRSRTWVWATVLAFSVSLLVALAPFWVLGPDVATQVYGDDAVYGWANAAWGAGAVAGGVGAAFSRPARPILAGMLVSAPWPLGVVAFAVGPPLPVVYAVLAASGAGLGLFMVWWETALVQRIPPHLLSRVSAWDWMGSLALLPVGYLLAGPVAARLGAVQVLVGGGLLGTLSCTLALLPSSTRGLTRLPDQPEPVGERA